MSDQLTPEAERVKAELYIALGDRLAGLTDTVVGNIARQLALAAHSPVQVERPDEDGWRCSLGHRNAATEATCYLCGDKERRPARLPERPDEEVTEAMWAFTRFAADADFPSHEWEEWTAQLRRKAQALLAARPPVPEEER